MSIKVLSVTLDKKSEDVVITKFGVHELSNDVSERLSQMYEIIGCDCVTCTEIEVEGNYYDVWSDDEALLKDNSIPVLYVTDELVIFGNVIFARVNKEGDMKGLSAEDIEILIDYFRKQYDKLVKWVKENSKPIIQEERVKC